MAGEPSPEVRESWKDRPLPDANAVSPNGAPPATHDPAWCILPDSPARSAVRHEWRAFPVGVPGSLTPQLLLVTYCVHCRTTEVAPLPIGRGR